MAKEKLLWDDPKYMKNSNSKQDLEKFLADPTLNDKKGYKKLNINYDDIKQSLYNLNQKNPEYQKILPEGLDKETGFILKHQLDAFYNGYSDTNPKKIMSIENIRKLQNQTTKNEIANLLNEHSIKGKISNLKKTNEDNIISLSRMGLLELNEEGKKLSPKNTKKTVTENMATAFKSKLEKDPSILAEKAKENKEDKEKEIPVGKEKANSDLAEKLKNLNEKIVSETKEILATGKKNNFSNTLASNNKRNESTTSKSENKKVVKQPTSFEKSKQNSNVTTNAASTIQNFNTEAGSAVTTSNEVLTNNIDTSSVTNKSIETNTGISDYSIPVTQNNISEKPKEKFNHYQENTVINGANLKLEFELGKWRAEAYSNDQTTKSKAEEMKTNLEKQITDKYSKMDLNTRNYWKKNYESSLSEEQKKTKNTEVQQRINALNVGIAKINELNVKDKSNETANTVKDINKVIKDPKTVSDFQHNIGIREKELKKLQETDKTLSYKIAVEKRKHVKDEVLLSNLENQKKELQSKIKAVNKEISVQQTKRTLEENKELAKKSNSNDRGEGLEVSGIRMI